LIKKYIQNKLTKTGSFIKKFASDITLFVDFVKHTDYQSYLKWSLDDNKKLNTVFIEWLFNYVGHYVFIGFMIALAYGDISKWYLCAVVYWLVFRLLLLLRTGK